MLPGSSYLSARSLRVARLRGKVGLYFVAALSVLAGMTDAIGFMATGDFVSFMSGNTTRLAVSLGEGEFALVLRIGVVLLAFVLGNALGVVIARLTGRRPWPLLSIIAALLALAGLLPLSWQLPALVAAVTAMGMINAVVEEVNGLPIGLTYVTGALSRFGRGLGRALLGERRHGWRVQLIPWTGMFVGAIAGVLLEQVFDLAALLFSALLAAALGLISLKIPRRWQLGYMPR
ncbi:YoaK family protein [Pseudomonas alkylphenolica]|uniref:Membrane protein n=1 Tax=Pseudomonas alkylphenolica TaxID=237609 RepID=A0A077FGW0_9PSED|nr:YoaK family protein [Pseudomonas alkylphenolica]AIL62501.1 membrane protein [Pseudomonas alkylphenolica]